MNPKTEYAEDQWREKRYRAGGRGDRFQQRACAACSYGMHGRLSKAIRGSAVSSMKRQCVIHEIEIAMREAIPYRVDGIKVISSMSCTNMCMLVGAVGPRGSTRSPTS